MQDGHGLKRRSATIAGFMISLMATTAAAGPQCKCRAYGQEYPQGQILCIRGKLARCGMNLNNSSWNVILNSCPQAELSPSPLPHSAPPHTKEL